MEYINISDPEFQRIADMMPDCCVMEIRKMKNNTNDYNTRLKFLRDSSQPATVKEMFHGTKFEHINSIIAQGLRASFNKVSAYGKGTYFSPDVKFSLSGYTNKSERDKLSYVFLCDVIKEDTKGNGTNIYVSPSDDSFQIKYLISFYKET